MTTPETEIKGIIWDVEANGLLDTVSEVYCISYKYYKDTKVNTLQGNQLSYENIYNALVAPGLPLVGHYILNYDLPLLKRFYNLDIVELLGLDNIIDTLVMSQCLFPDRPVPKSCPVSIFNPIENRSKKVTSHSLEAWGYRVSHNKVKIDNWSDFSDDIIKRCEEDVLLNEKVFTYLLKEAGIVK